MCGRKELHPILKTWRTGRSLREPSTIAIILPLSARRHGCGQQSLYSAFDVNARLQADARVGHTSQIEACAAQGSPHHEPQHAPVHGAFRINSGAVWLPSGVRPHDRQGGCRRMPLERAPKTGLGSLT
jgi:hypothetical protein